MNSLNRIVMNASPGMTRCLTNAHSIQWILKVLWKMFLFRTVLPSLFLACAFYVTLAGDSTVGNYGEEPSTGSRPDCGFRMRFGGKKNSYWTLTPEWVKESLDNLTGNKN